MWGCWIEIVVAVVAGAGGVVPVYGCSSAPSGLWCVGMSMTQDNRQPHLPPLRVALSCHSPLGVRRPSTRAP